MGVASRIGRFLKPLVNFPRWMGLGELRKNFQAIKQMVKDLKMHRPKIRQESFEEAVVRMQLTEADIVNRKRTCLLLSILYAFLGFLFFLYSLLLVIRLHYSATIAFLITALMAVFAYRESFWYFQMKTRTLGNNFRSWLSFMLRGSGK